MIERGDLPPTARRMASRASGGTRRLKTRLIGDILDIARIRSGKLSIDLQRVDLQGVVAAAVETLEAEADAKCVRLEAASDRGLLVQGDPSRLQQILWNMVSNAVKFTPEGGSVRVEARRCGARARLVVRDTGVGIEPGFLPRVFDRFRQGDASTTRHHSGLGLGLAITKHLAELHGGKVWAESDGPGRGAAFTLELPLHVPAGEEREQSASGGELGAESALIDRRVLVVDDDPDSRQIAAMILANAGAVVDTAASAAAGYACATTRGYDLLIADISMPGEDGYSLVRRIRARLGDAQRMPSIAVTAHAREEDRAKALSAGFIAHLAKPFEADRLLELATSALRTAAR